MGKRDFDVDDMIPRTGRLGKEDNTYFNEADMWLDVYDSGANALRTSGGGATTPGTLVNAQKTVTTAGSAEALAITTTIQSITIKALSTNTGIIYIGDSTVASGNGFELESGEILSLEIDDPAKIFADTSVDGEGVSFVTLAA